MVPRTELQWRKNKQQNCQQANIRQWGLRRGRRPTRRLYKCHMTYSLCWKKIDMRRKQAHIRPNKTESAVGEEDVASPQSPPPSATVHWLYIYLSLLQHPCNTTESEQQRRPCVSVSRSRPINLSLGFHKQPTSPQLLIIQTHYIPLTYFGMITVVFDTGGPVYVPK
jgi:hypothetical protein